MRIRFSLRLSAPLTKIVCTMKPPCPKAAKLKQQRTMRAHLWQATTNGRA
jgi:hypothetical protein